MVPARYVGVRKLVCLGATLADVLAAEETEPGVPNGFVSDGLAKWEVVLGLFKLLAFLNID